MATFSNGTEWEIWSSRWCDTCIKDRPARRDDYQNACTLILEGMLGNDVPQWHRNSGDVTQVTCDDYELDPDAVR